MAEESPSKNEGLISFSDYFKGWRGLARRLPTVLRTQRQMAKIGTENRESWGSMLEENADKFPDNLAVKSAEAQLSWRQYNEAVNRYANYFIFKGLKKGDVACVLLENRPELLIVYSAMAKIGVVNSMINTNLRQESLLHCLKLNAASIFIVGEEVLDAFEEVNAELYSGGDLNPGENRKIYFHSIFMKAEAE